MQLGQQRGILTTWKNNRGFGFITPHEGGEDIFVHISDFKGLTDRPRRGDRVGFDLVVKAGKRRAQNAYIICLHQKQVAKTAIAPRTSYSRFPWEVIPLSIFPLGCALYLALEHNLLFLLLYLFMSLLTFRVYAHDKRRAQAYERRTPEKTLHSLELLGGWPGGLIAQQKLRHKTKKTSYQTTFWGIVFLHYLGWISWLIIYIQN